jgi:hypothetical protein
MTTVVFTPSEGMQQQQVGAADIVALLTAAHSAWGWIGGLNGLKSIIEKARTYVGLHGRITVPLNTISQLLDFGFARPDSMER